MALHQSLNVRSLARQRHGFVRFCEGGMDSIAKPTFPAFPRKAWPLSEGGKPGKPLGRGHDARFQFLLTEASLALAELCAC